MARGLHARHPCVLELKSFLEDRKNTQKRQQALSCVREVMETSEAGEKEKRMQTGLLRARCHGTVSFSSLLTV